MSVTDGGVSHVAKNMDQEEVLKSEGAHNRLWISHTLYLTPNPSLRKVLLSRRKQSLPTPIRRS